MNAISSRQVDLDSLLASVDMDALLDRIDVGALLDKIDLEVLLARIDLDSLLASVDVEALVRRMDLDDLLAEIDLDRLLASIDINGLIQRLDMDALVANTELGSVIAQSTSGVASHALDSVRSQGVGMDNFIARVTNRVLRRHEAELVAGPPRLIEAQLALPSPDTADTANDTTGDDAHRPAPPLRRALLPDGFVEQPGRSRRGRQPAGPLRGCRHPPGSVRARPDASPPQRSPSRWR